MKMEGGLYFRSKDVLKALFGESQDGGIVECPRCVKDHGERRRDVEVLEQFLNVVFFGDVGLEDVEVSAGIREGIQLKLGFLRGRLSSSECNVFGAEFDDEHGRGGEAETPSPPVMR